MKNFTLLFVSFFFFIVTLSAQRTTTLNRSVSAETIRTDGKIHKEGRQKLQKASAVTCGNDSIFYVGYKSTSAQLLSLVGNGRGSYGEGLGQWFDAPQPIAVHGFTFYGRSKYSTLTPVNVSIYSATTDSTPNVLLGTATTLLDFTEPNLTAMQRNVNFTTPIAVTGPYVVVVEAPAASTDTIELALNADDDGYGEKLSKIRVFGTEWIDLDFAYGGFDVDFFVEPIVSYDLSSTFSVSGNLAPGETINFTNTSSPVLFSRFYNLAVLFDQTADSFAWNFGDALDEGPAIDTSHVYAESGSYSVKLTSTIYGYSADCMADTTGTVVISRTAPVTLSKFTGEQRTGSNLLTWSTETEQDNTGFELQRSANGNDFSALAFVPTKAASGNSSSTIKYQFEDTKPFAGDAYYRLKQIDKDGKSTLSSVVLIKGVKANRLVLSNVYPNPAKTVVNLVIGAPANDRITVVVSDLAGKVVLQQAATIIAGDNKVSLNVRNLAPGSYMIKTICSSGCETAVSKFLKQ